MSQRHSMARFGFLVAIISAIHLFTVQTVVAKPPTASQTERLVTGDAARIGEVVAGTGATLKFYFTPRPPLPGNGSNFDYPTGWSINGQELTVYNGGFVSVWITQIEGWDPDQDHHPLLQFFQDQINVPGQNISPPNSCALSLLPSLFSCTKTCSGGAQDGNTCTSDAKCIGGVCMDPCPELLGENGPECGADHHAGYCPGSWQNPTRSDWIFAGLTSDHELHSSTVLDDAFGGPLFNGTTDGISQRFDSGGRFYTGTLLLSVPLSCCKGTYTISHKASKTYAIDEAVPSNSIPIAALISGQLECQIGRCCTNIGSSNTCTTNVNYFECNSLPSSNGHVFLPGSTCTTPCCAPAGSPCHFSIPHPECITGQHCDSTGICVNDPAPESTPCNLTSSNPCLSPEVCDGQGGCFQHDPVPEGTSCNLTSSNQCLSPAVCDGQGNCLQNDPLPEGTSCNLTSSNQCLSPAVCDGQGQCFLPPAPMGTACTLQGASNDPCLLPAICDGAGNCFQPPAEMGTPCILPNSVCTTDPSCNGQGQCVRQPAPAGTPCNRVSTSPCLVNPICDGQSNCVFQFAKAGTLCTLTNSPCQANPSCDGQGNCVGQSVPVGTPCTIASNPCLANSTCNSAGNCVGGVNDNGPECLKNRYVTIAPEATGGLSALRVTLTSLMHPQPPNLLQFPPPNFTALEGQIRWVGQINDCEETELPPTIFKCAYLQCTPFYADWSSQLNGQWLHLMGKEIVPSSLYTIDQFNASCQGNESNCADIAMTVQVETARHGDVAPAFQLTAPGSPLTQPNISDVSAIVDKFKGVPTAVSRTRAQLVPGAIGINQRVSITDVATDVDAFVGLSYIQPGPQQCP
ncbi:MAG: hypothetical protein HY287_05910 [Planctomycetes bacterium]|nr:hypothetical protein [Planctomycetota bacterium]MBI3833847.1 hypothetical protein [Planctomycetota bacterium]